MNPAQCIPKYNMVAEARLKELENKMSARGPIVSGAVLALIIAMMGAALAGPRAGTVTAYSDYGNGALRAPVRIAQYGYQVRLPGGYWHYCEISGLLSYKSPCSETLRRESLDFWETIAEDLSAHK